jgi:hypothetical protein
MKMQNKNDGDEVKKEDRDRNMEWKGRDGTNEGQAA